MTRITGAWVRLCVTVWVIFLALNTLAADTPVTGREEPALAAFDQVMLSFLKEHDVPGASLAIARNGRIVYTRGFGYADVAKKEAVEPESLFRIASVSKMFTGAAVLQLQERGNLRFDDHAFELLAIPPRLAHGAQVDPRLWRVTISQLLHHTGGFDRNASFDPMFRPILIAKATGTKPPAGPREIIEYEEGMPLDFDPGTKESYSNYGYCVLGRLIEKASGMTYSAYVTREVLQPLGISRMGPGRTLEANRCDGEVRYYPRGDARVKSVWADGTVVSVAYGGCFIEAMDSHGGWIASAPELVRFASSLDDPEHCPILKPETVRTMFARPKDTGFDGNGKPKDAYYTCGWEVRPAGKSGKVNTWHSGLLDGTASLVVRRYDGLSWAVLFNTDYDAKHKYLATLIDPLLHRVADGINQWPHGWEFVEPKTTRAK